MPFSSLESPTVPYREVALSCDCMFAFTMAKQAGDIRITGTLDDLTFYKMDGKYYVRLKSSLTRKRFMKDKAFERSRKSAERFALGNQLASKLYRMIEKEKQVYKLFCFLKRKAILLLKEEKNIKQVEAILVDHLIDFGAVEKRIEKAKHTGGFDQHHTPAKLGGIRSTTALTPLMIHNKLLKYTWPLSMMSMLLCCKGKDAPQTLYAAYRKTCGSGAGYCQG